MKTKFKLSTSLIVIILLVNSFTAYASEASTSPEKDKFLVYVLREALKELHFLKKDIDDHFSELVYKNFIDGLDPNKRYFTQEDIAEFSKFKYQIDNQLLANDLSFYNLVYSRFSDKIENIKTYYSSLLDQPFDFKKDEIINIDYSEVPFAKNENELIDYWRKQLKLNILNRIQAKDEEQKTKLKEDTKFKPKAFETLEKEARMAVLKNMDELYMRLKELEHKDWFLTFLNSVVGTFDPHTVYMPPRIKDRFEQDISGKLEGIGAILQKKGIHTSIVRLISGGPAWKQGELEAEDIILKVAQGNQEPLNIVGMRLGDAIKFIKGKKGTEVRLTIKKKIDGSTKTISIIRDVVELEETFVKSSIVKKDGKTYGVINLPKFYISFEDQDYRDSTKDMKKEIERLKQENVSGLLIDLRNNFGGSLKTAVEIAGLFIDEGAIVQIKSKNKKLPVAINDPDPKKQWDGPLVVLVNELSASSSEIFSAAMQDYKRAVIVGANQTYGKGTVQYMFPINKAIKYNEDLGHLKLTVQKYYRINGGSTQLEGVYSDIAIPSKYSYMKFGERNEENSLIWDKVPQAKYKQTDLYENFSDVINQSKKRIASDTKYQVVNEYAKWLKKNQDESLYSLSYDAFQKQIKTQKEQMKKFESLFKYNSELKFSSPKYELALLEKDTSLADKRSAWHRNLSKDIYVSEALNVLSELKLKKPSIEIAKN